MSISTQPLPAKSPASNTRRQRGVAEVAADVVKLADLQLQLVAVDSLEFWSRAQAGIVLAGSGSVILLAAIPVLLFAAARSLAAHLQLSEEVSLYIVSATAIVISGALVAWGARRLSRAAKPLRRSREELHSNMMWLRSLIHDEA